MGIIDIDKIKRYFAKQPVLKAWLFGSFARGEERDDSDVDILVSFDEEAKVSLLKHAGMLCNLEDLLNRPVDLVNELSLYPEVRKTVNNDKILIYERETLRDPSRLMHMVGAIHNVNQYMEEKSVSDLESNSMLFFAVVKNIEIVGEAAYKLTNEFKERHSETPWRQIIAMRHILVHGYYQRCSNERDVLFL